MKDLVGKEINKGDFIFYAVRRSSGLYYRFARVIYVDNDYETRGVKGRLCVLPVIKHYWKDEYRTGIKSYLYNTPLLVYEVPDYVSTVINSHKLAKEFWG